MQPALQKLTAISSGQFVEKPDTALVDNFLVPWGRPGQELAELLAIRNGFQAFESSLVVRPFSADGPIKGLVEWNKRMLWKKAYNENLDNVLCFADDAFGFQYCIVGEKIELFNSETAEFEEIADSLWQWAQIILDDSNFRTGFPLVHDWQILHGPLQPGTRLLPKVPFVLGGEYKIENLYAGDEVEGMLFRGSIANQICNIPDGQEIALKLINKPEN